MPHYADGTPAMQGDLVLKLDPYDNGTDLFGIVATITPSNGNCNAQVMPLAIRQRGAPGWIPMSNLNWWCVTLKECTKMGDRPIADTMTIPIAAPATASG